jgi:hypothetical protein
VSFRITCLAPNLQKEVFAIPFFLNMVLGEFIQAGIRDGFNDYAKEA